MAGACSFSRPGVRRRALPGTTAVLVAPWTGAFATDAALPRFSMARPGAGIPPGWVHETLPKVERPNEYEIVPDQGTSMLRVRSSASASSLVTPVRIGAAVAVSLQWRWKVSRPLAGSDLRLKARDYYAARVYVLFDLPAERLSLADRVRIQAPRTLPAGSTGRNPLVNRLRMVVVESGSEQAMRRRSAERDLRRDWQEAFPSAMPPFAAWRSEQTRTTRRTAWKPGSATWFWPRRHEASRAARRRTRTPARAGGTRQASAAWLGGAAGESRRAPDFYSVMLPGWVAGHSTLAQCVIDLQGRARAAAARLLLDSATALDLPNQNHGKHCRAAEQQKAPKGPFRQSPVPTEQPQTWQDSRPPWSAGT